MNEALRAVFLRDLKIAFRAGGGAGLGVVFFLALVTVVPFAIGPDLPLLARIGPAILWIGALLATLLGLDRIFSADREDGSLDVMMFSPAPLELIAAAKGAAHWVATGLPLAIAAPLFGLLLGVEPAALGALTLTLVITAFEWKFQVYTAPVVLPEPVEGLDFVVLPTTQPEAAPPPVRKTQETSFQKPELPDKPPVELSKVVAFKPDDATGVKTVSFTLPDEPVRSKSTEPFLRVEKQPEPSGGWEDFYEYLAKNLRHRPRAKQMGLEGFSLLWIPTDRLPA